MTTEDAIVVKALSKRYPGSHGETEALSAVDFAVRRSDVFGFLGPNGAGKTTTIRILATILEPSSGTAVIGGHDIRESPLEARQCIGYMPETSDAYPLLTGLDSLSYWGRLQGLDSREARNRAKNLLTELGLSEAAGRKTKSYSHGMRKRLLIAHALIHDPAILLLDEPAGGLDPQGVRFFRDLVRRLHAEGKTIFLSSHMLSEVEQICRTVGVIQRGRILVVDEMGALRRRLGTSGVLRIEIECDPPGPDAIDSVRALPGVSVVSGSGSGIVVQAIPNGGVVEAVIRVLAEAKVGIRAVRPQEPSLEDAFFSLTEARSG